MTQNENEETKIKWKPHNNRFFPTKQSTFEIISEFWNKNSDLFTWTSKENLWASGKFQGKQTDGVYKKNHQFLVWFLHINMAFLQIFCTIFMSNKQNCNLFKGEGPLILQNFKPSPFFYVPCIYIYIYIYIPPMYIFLFSKSWWEENTLRIFDHRILNSAFPAVALGFCIILVVVLRAVLPCGRCLPCPC